MRAGTTSGDVARAYRDRDRVEDHTDIDTVIDRWTASRDRGVDVLLLAGRRDQVTALNRAARTRLQAQGVVGSDRCVLGGRPYAIGDQVVTLRNDHHLSVLNGIRGVITNTDDSRLRLRLRDGRRVNIPHAYAEAGWLDHRYALTIHKAQGLTATRPSPSPTTPSPENTPTSPSPEADSATGSSSPPPTASTSTSTM